MQKRKVLAVDDEPFNLDILTEYLERENLEVITAEDGVIALQKIALHPDIDLIILDRMMPNMDGMEVIAALKKDERYRHIPIIMQTAAAQSAQILEGIQAGVYYYLTKPYEESFLISIVRSALRPSYVKKKIGEEEQYEGISQLIKKAECHFSTLEEVKRLACFFANAFPDRDMALYGLTELMLNAIEHGNLGITCEEKTGLILQGTLYDEIERRLQLPHNKDKFAFLQYEVTENEIYISITDQGEGFDWEKYIVPSPYQMTKPNGRGVATAKLSFTTMEYLGKGNQVVCKLVKEV